MLGQNYRSFKAVFHTVISLFGQLTDLYADYNSFIARNLLDCEAKVMAAGPTFELLKPNFVLR